MRRGVTGADVPPGGAEGVPGVMRRRKYSRGKEPGNTGQRRRATGALWKGASPLGGLPEQREQACNSVSSAGNSHPQLRRASRRRGGFSSSAPEHQEQVEKTSRWFGDSREDKAQGITQKMAVDDA